MDLLTSFPPGFGVSLLPMRKKKSAFQLRVPTTGPLRLLPVSNQTRHQIGKGCAEKSAGAVFDATAKTVTIRDQSEGSVASLPTLVEGRRKYTGKEIKLCKNLF